MKSIIVGRGKKIKIFYPKNETPNIGGQNKVRLAVDSYTVLMHYNDIGPIKAYRKGLKNEKQNTKSVIRNHEDFKTLQKRLYFKILQNVLGSLECSK